VLTIGAEALSVIGLSSGSLFGPFGTAVSFFDPTHTTSDLDTFVRHSYDWDAFATAYEKAKRSTGLEIEVQNATVASFPESYEERLEVAPIEGLANDEETARLEREMPA
jgi:hypothetical protein